MIRARIGRRYEQQSGFVQLLIVERYSDLKLVRLLRSFAEEQDSHRRW